MAADGGGSLRRHILFIGPEEALSQVALAFIYISCKLTAAIN